MSIKSRDTSVITPWPKQPYNDPVACRFCPTVGNSLFSFQGVPICGECNDKLIERIKLIMNFQ